MATRPATPVDILGSQLGPWFDASDSANIVVSQGVVSQWSDKSGLGAHLTNTTTAQRPTLNNTGLNGLPAVSHNGSQGLFNGAISQSIFSANRLIGCFSAFQFGATTKNSERIVSLANSSQNDYEGQSYIPILRQGTNAVVGSNRANSYYADTVALANATPTVLCTYYPTSTTHQITKDGTAGTAISTVTSSQILPRLGLGCQGNGALIGSNSTFGAIGEVVFALDAITVAQRQQLEGYLAWKWGLQGNLPAAHPYKAAAPTVDTGGAAGSVNDTATGNDSQSAVASAAASATDVGTGADSITGAAANTATLADTGTGGDNAVASAAATGAATDAGTSSDAVTASAANTASVTDAGTATDAASATATASGSLADTGAGGDSSAASVAATGSATDAGASSDSVTAANATTAIAIDAGTGSDAASAQAAASTAATDAGLGTDAVSASASALGSTSDAGTGSDAVAASQSLSATATDTGSATDSVTAVVTNIRSVSDVGTAPDTISAQVAASAATNDVSAGSDLASYVGQIKFPPYAPMPYVPSAAGGGGGGGGSSSGSGYNSYDPEAHRRREEEERGAQRRPALGADRATAPAPLPELASTLPPLSAPVPPVNPLALGAPLAAADLLAEDDDEAMALLLAA